LRRWGARRLLILGGIGLILTGMFFGDIFAVYTLHQNAAQVWREPGGGCELPRFPGNRQAVLANFRNVGMFLENRGTKVDTHVHMIDFWLPGAVAGDSSALCGIRGKQEEEANRNGSFWRALGYCRLASISFHYVGFSAQSAEVDWLGEHCRGPWRVAGPSCHAGLPCRLSGASSQQGQRQPRGRSAERPQQGRTLVVCGRGLRWCYSVFFHGAYYAASDLYRHEAQDYSLLAQMSGGGSGGRSGGGGRCAHAIWTTAGR